MHSITSEILPADVSGLSVFVRPSQDSSRRYVPHSSKPIIAKSSTPIGVGPCRENAAICRNVKAGLVTRTSSVTQISDRRGRVLLHRWHAISSRLRSPDLDPTRMLTGRLVTPRRSISSCNMGAGGTPQPSRSCFRVFSRNAGARRPLERINSSADAPQMHTEISIAPSWKYRFHLVVKIPKFGGHQRFGTRHFRRFPLKLVPHSLRGRRLDPKHSGRTEQNRRIHRMRHVCMRRPRRLSPPNLTILTRIPKPYACTRAARQRHAIIARHGAPASVPDISPSASPGFKTCWDQSKRPPVGAVTEM